MRSKIHHPLAKKVLFTYQQIDEKVKEIASKINEFYMSDEKTNIIIIGVLKGAIPFFSLLLKYIDFDCKIDFCGVSSFNGETNATTKPILKTNITTLSLKNENVLIVEDIIDSGFTIEFLKNMFIEKGAIDVKIVALLDKKDARKTDINPDFSGFIVENHFLFGFGLDIDEKLRNLDYIAICDEEKLKKWEW